MVEKTIMSVGAGGDKFKYLDLDTQLVEIEAGLAVNEPVTYAWRKTIEGAVVELIKAGEVRGLWKYKPKPEPEPEPVVETPTEEELIEEIIEADNEVRETAKEEVYDDYKKKPEVVEVEEVEIEEEKVELMEVGDPPGQSNGDDFDESLEELDEEIIPNTPIITPDIANILRG